MSTRAFGVCLSIVLASCAGMTHRAVRLPPVDAAPIAAKGAALPKYGVLIPYHCNDLPVSADLARFAELSLHEIWEEMVRVGADGIPPFYAADAALLTHGLLRNLAPALCADTHPGTRGFAILLMPFLADLPRSKQPAAGLPGLYGWPGPADPFWTDADSRSLVSNVTGHGLPPAAAHPSAHYFVPFGSGSLIQLSPPRYELRGGFLFQGLETDLHQPPSMGSVVQDQFLDYRLRLPTGTVRVLIWKF